MIPALESVQTIMVRLPNWVGDIVMASPVYDALRLNFPQATIVACVRPYARGIVEHGPWFDQIIDCDDKSFAGLRRVVSQVRALKPDMALLLPNSTHSFVTAKLAGVSQVYGYRRNLRKYFLSGGPEPQRDGKQYRPIPMQDYYLELCRHLQLHLPNKPECRLYTDQALDDAGCKRLASYGISPQDRLIGLNPGASFGASKCWPATHFARLAEMLQNEMGAKVMLFVGPGEEQIAEAIVSESQVKLINTGPDRIDLAELKPLIKRCNALVTNDTGPRHYAVALGVPTVVLMGPTNPLYTAINLEGTSVIRLDIPCSPCHKKICPTDHQCMTEIKPQQVFDELNALLRNTTAHETGSLSQTVA